jgi:hypothetical protein
MKNGKNFFGLTALKCVGIFAVLATLGACVTEPVVFDESIPPEETATVNFAFLQPTAYNGIPVDKKKWVRTKIPQGETSFVVDIYGPDRESGVVVRGSGFIINYNFEGGKEYSLYFAQKGDLYGADVYNAPLPKINWPPEDALIGFVPFENQPDTITY